MTDPDTVSMKLEVDIGQWIIDERGSTLLDEILRQAAALLLEHLGRDEVVQGLRDEIRRARTAEILKQLEPIVRDAINEPVQRTDSFGNPTGPATSIREIVHTQVQSELRDAHEAQKRSSMKPPLFVRLVEEVVKRELNTELREALDEAKAKATEAIRSRAADMLAEEMGRRR